MLKISLMNFLSLLDKLVEIVIKNKIRRHTDEYCDTIAIHQHSFCKEKLSNDNSLSLSTNSNRLSLDFFFPLKKVF